MPCPTPVALLVLLATAGPLGADEPEPRGKACLEEETEGLEYLVARYQWYVATYGEAGAFDPEKRLAETRAAYRDHQNERRGRTARALAPFEPGAFRFAGPTNGAGRATTVEPDPLDPATVYVGAAGGGCWKSTDAGASWRSLTDALADLSVGAVAVAPSLRHVVYLGTGEGGYAGAFIPGIGILRSDDAGETWRLPGSVVAPMVYRLSVDPRDADVVLAFTNLGVLRSVDGGLGWAATSPSSWRDATDVARSPANPDVLHATFWSYATAESSRYARSTDGGRSWTERTRGLPPDPKGRMSVGLSNDGRTVYLLVSGPRGTTTRQVGLYRSTDGGETFSQRLGATPDILGAQGWYDNCVAVDPDDANVVLLSGVRHYRSTDGGLTATRYDSEKKVHVDGHHLVFVKYGNVKHLWNANDGGVFRSLDGGVEWQDRNAGLETRQYYAVSVDPARPDVLFAGSQDNGTDRRPGPGTAFEKVLGGDGFETAVDTASPNVVYATGQWASLYRSTRSGEPGTFTYVGRPFAGVAFTSGGGDGVKPFYSWVTLDPTDPSTVYTGTWRVWRSRDRGTTWAPLSSSAFSSSSPTNGLAVVAARPERLLAASWYGVLLSDDGGASFVNLSNGRNGLPTTVVVRNVDLDPSNPDVMVACTGASSTAVPGRVFVTRNGGATWARSDAGLPDFGVEVVRFDPGDPRTLYAGTLVGLYRSTDGGSTWNRWGDGLPAAAVHDIRLLPDGSQIALATHGRGLWVAPGGTANHPPVVTIESPDPSVTIDPNGSVTFAGSAVDPDGDPLVLTWTLGEGMTATGPSPGTVTYRHPGQYRVAAVARDGKGALGAAYVTVNVRPYGETCETASPLALVPGERTVFTTGNAAAASWDPSDPASCPGTVVSHTLWLTLTAPAPGTLTLDTEGSLGDTVMALYRGTCGGLTLVECNDDADGTGGFSRLSPVRVTAGSTLRLLVGSWTSTANPPASAVESLAVRALFTPDDAALESGVTAIQPVLVDARGASGSHFTSDLLLLNRGAEPLSVALTWGGDAGTGPKSAAVVLPSGAQVRAPDALAELRRLGIAVPEATAAAPQAGSLSAFVTSGDPSALVVAARTTTPNPNGTVGGSFGLFDTGVLAGEAADSVPVHLFGLRQTARDRTNLALVHVPTEGSPRNAPITLAVELFDAAGKPAPVALPALTLLPGEFQQVDEVLKRSGLEGSSDAAGNGAIARVRRTAGSGRFVAYAVVNDQATSDGSLVPMVRSGEATAAGTLVVPVVLDARGLGGSRFTSELVLANRSARSGSAILRYVAAPLLSDAGSGTVEVPLAAGAQRIVPDVVGFLRENGLAIPAEPPQGGALFVSFSGFDAGDDVHAGVRTTTPNPDASQGGSFGVFLPGVPASGLASGSALVPGLRQDRTVRANLAAVNAGPEPVTLVVSVHAAADGRLLGSTSARALAPGEWFQWSNVFFAAGAGEGEGYAVVTRTAGTSPWYAYGVLNDAATSDGSVLRPVR